MKDEIIIYQSDEASIRLEVRIEEETVWLSQGQMVELFQSLILKLNTYLKG